MKMTSLCYLEKDGKYLMLHRTVKENDENRDKWIGIGGKLESGESPHDCARREILEETGFCADTLNYRGLVTFVSNEYGTEYMHLFTCNDFSGKMISECDEGELAWVDIDKIHTLPIWEGDKIFFELLKNESRFFSLKLVYDKDSLVSHTVYF